MYLTSNLGGMDVKLLLCYCTIDPIINATVAPTMYSGKDIHPFNMFDLTCTARKPISVIPPLQLSWYYNGMQLDASVTGITIREEEMNNGMKKISFLSVTSALTSNSGAYTCKAVISIPDSTALINNQSATVTIAGM